MDRTQNILVATSRYLLKVDIETEKFEVVNDKYGQFYGITWDHDFIYVAARWYPRLMPTGHIERPRLLVFNSRLKLVDCQEYPLEANGLHQILYRDGRLYYSCSRDDSFIIRENNDWSPWHPSENSEDHGTDVHHFNSIWINNERLFIIGHNNGPSDVWEYSYPKRNLICKYRVGKLIHNIWKENGVLTVCNSGAGSVETVEGKILCLIKGFPRGAVIAPDVNLIGVSSIANRSNRWMSPGKIRVYSKDWELLKEIELGRCGQVNEIRSLDNGDIAHNGLVPPQ